MRQKRIAAMLAAAVFCAAASAQLCLAADAPAQKNDFLKNYIEDGDPLPPAIGAYHEPWCDNEAVPQDCEGQLYNAIFARIVDISDCSSSSNMPCTITATLALEGDDLDYAKEKPRLSVQLIYAVDGGKAETIPMADKDNDIYAATIPAQRSGAKVDYTIRATDQFGNTTIGTLPAISPAIRLSRIIQDDDSSSDIVPDDLDIIDTSVGLDAEYIYLRYTVQGKISQGSQDPPFVHIYATHFMNPDTDNIGFFYGKYWFYSPLFPGPLHTIANGFLFKETYQDIKKHLVDTGMLFADMKNAAVTSRMEDVFPSQPVFEKHIAGNEFIGKIKRDAFGETKSGQIRTMIITGANTGGDKFSYVPLDTTVYINLYLGQHSYIAK